MEGVLHTLHVFIEYFAEYAIILCDIIGMIVLLCAVISGFVRYFRRGAGKTKIRLVHGIALALEFKLAGEVLRTVTIRTIGELIVLAVIIILRAAMAVLLHWELKTESKGGEHDYDNKTTAGKKDF